MSALTLHYHPLSSYCWKAMIAIDALGIPVEARMYNPMDPAQRDAFLKLWPTGKMPLLVDEGRVVPETSIIIEYLQRHHARDGRSLIPQDADAALDVRLWDRLFDLYVMTPMNVFTSDLLKPEGERDAKAVARAREHLLMAYAMIDRQLYAGRAWIAGDAFSMADCSAAPSLFYAIAYVPLTGEHAPLAAYFERLMAHPSVAKSVEGARPFFQYFPGKAGLEKRFYDSANG